MANGHGGFASGTPGAALSALQEDLATVGLKHIEVLAKNVARADNQAQEARAELVRAMREAYGPHTLQQIGEAAGLSRQRVQQIIKEEK